MNKGGRTSTTWERGSSWNHGKTQTIRVPIAIAEQVLDYARTVDSKLIKDLFQDIPSLPGDFLQEWILKTIDDYIEYKRQNYHPNQHSRELEISTRPWDELRKFRTMVKSSYGTFDKTSVE